jgi:hypothetical protein
MKPAEASTVFDHKVYSRVSFSSVSTFSFPSSYTNFPLKM